MTDTPRLSESVSAMMDQLADRLDVTNGWGNLQSFFELWHLEWQGVSDFFESSQFDTAREAFASFTRTILASEPQYVAQIAYALCAEARAPRLPVVLGAGAFVREMESSPQLAQLEAQLRLEGWVFREGVGVIHKDTPVVEVTRERTWFTEHLDRHPELSAAILKEHFAEIEKKYAASDPRGVVSNARHLMEQVLTDIAVAIAAQRDEASKFKPDRAVEVRNYLLKVGFVDDDEHKKLLSSLYGFFSEFGNHPGIPEPFHGRFARYTIYSLANYILEKLVWWKRTHK